MSLGKYQSNKRLAEKIGESIRNGRVFHAHIIEGDSFSDKEGFARELCKAIMCLEKPGEGCDLDYTAGDGVAMNVDVAISNSLGFGGHNASLIVRKFSE